MSKALESEQSTGKFDRGNSVGTATRGYAVELLNLYRAKSIRDSSLQQVVVGERSM